MPKIHADFQNMLKARKAVEKLREMGYRDAHLDAVEKFYDEHAAEINFAGNRNTPSLSTLVLKSKGHIYNVGNGPLLAANPMVSGMGSYGELADDVNTRLLVSVEDEKVDEVKRILEELGAAY